VNSSTPSTSKRSTVGLPSTQPYESATYFWYFDPIAGRYSKTVLDTGKPTKWSTQEPFRESAILEVFVAYRARLVGLLYAARVCGRKADRVVIRLGPIENRFNRRVFDKRIKRLLDSSVEPGVWIRLANVDADRSPEWLVENERESIGIDVAPSETGKILHLGELLEAIEPLRLPNISNPGYTSMKALVGLVDLKWQVFGPSRLPIPSPRALLTLIRDPSKNAPDTKASTLQNAARLLGQRESPEVLLSVDAILNGLIVDKLPEIMPLLLLQEAGNNKPPDEPLSPPKESVEVELAAAVSRLIPKLPDPPEAKAKAIISLERVLHETYRTALRGEAEPLIKSLLQDIPADYAGKRDLTILINALFAALDFGILIHDRQGQPRVCSMQATRARPTDEKGQLRLCARSISSRSQRSFSLPPLDQLQIVETPREEQHHSAETTRTI
jgi:hypothetical protein